MNQIILLGVLIILITLITRLAFYIKFKFDLKAGRVRIFKLKEYRRFEWYNVIGVFVCVFNALVFYKIHDSFDYLIGWNTVSLTYLVNIFIAPVNYLLADNNGMKESYMGRKSLWKSLIIKQCNEKLSIQKGKQTMNFEFKEIGQIQTFKELALGSEIEIIE